MPLRTQLFQMLPWSGGLNTALDESMIPPNQLTVADNLIFDTRGSRKKRDGIDHDWDDASNSSASIIGLHDFWFGLSSKTQRVIGVTSSGKVYSYNGGTRTELTVTTPFSGTLTTCSMVTFNNKVIIVASTGASDTTNVVKYWAGTGDVEDLPGSPPKASFVFSHLGRLCLNDRANRDRLHYSPPNDHTLWNGAGDSGAFDIGTGDGDPTGLTGGRSFRGDAILFKRTKAYRLVGSTPEDLQILKMSDGIGCISHNSITPVENTELLWVSERGVHSMSATDTYGAFDAAFVSADIQRTFNEDFTKSRLPFVWGAYLDTINSVAFGFTMEGDSTNNDVYLYNIPLKSWYRWPNISCQSLIVANDADKKRFYFGTSTQRISQSFNGTNYDLNSSGTHTAVSFQVTTGLIFVDENPYTLKAFKRFVLYYRPRGSHTITAEVKIDNIQLNSENQLSFSSSGSGALLGSTFTLGVSQLGTDSILGPYTRHIDGYGRAVKVSFTQTGTDEEVEIQGFGIEWEPAGTTSEVA
jgi:hypothetical protein